jgi:predicted transcriptional regulator of viral defense system
VSAANTYAQLRRLGARALTTGEASAALRTSQSAASRSLRDLERKGLAKRVRFGLWVIGDEPVDPRALVAEITRPYPAYVSFASALATHGAIDQIPRAITVASLAKTRRVLTQFGTYDIHRLPPELFGGFEERGGVAIATVEKAIFDYFYVACASGHPDRRLPELDLPRSFAEKSLRAWTERIPSARLRTLVAAAIARALDHAEPEERGSD